MTQEQQMLQEAASEIRNLRRQNELMAAKLDMFDKCMLLLHTPPTYPSQGMSPDLVWQIDKYLANIEKL
jgi:hypothetical protein